VEAAGEAVEVNPEENAATVLGARVRGQNARKEVHSPVLIDRYRQRTGGGYNVRERVCGHLLIYTYAYIYMCVYVCECA